MTIHYGQYPDIYSTDDIKYTFFFDSGERVTLVAGKDGVTQEWIHALKLEHRNEYNMLRRGVKASSETRVFSLDQYMDEVGDEGLSLMDKSSDVEANYIAEVETFERRERIRAALDNLTPEQRDLLIRVRVRGITITSNAKEAGVTEGAIRDRLRKIEKKIRKQFC